jgi:hypothetical protein
MKTKERFFMTTFNVGGTWNLSQSNGQHVNLTLNQDVVSGHLTGSARFGGTSGTCDGFMKGELFFLNIKWTDGKFGEYNGRMGVDYPINRGSRLWGVARSSAPLTDQATWYGDLCFQGR